MFDSFYWSFVTATNLGCGDLRAVNRTLGIIAILIAIMGLTFTGILIGLAMHAASFALAAHDGAVRVP